MKRFSIDYKGRCGNCHSRLGEQDKFCRYCGTPKGRGKFLPYANENLCVYGPPTTTTHTCTSCSYSWTVHGLCTDGAEFCPRCGSGVSTDSKCEL